MTGPKVTHIKKNSDGEDTGHASIVERKSIPLYDLEKSAGFLLRLSKQQSTEGASRQGALVGDRPHPFDFESVAKFKIASEYHSTCIAARRDSIVGLGFEDEKTDDTLDPLCLLADSFQEVLNDVEEDTQNTGNGYMEVTREAPSSTAKILGLYHAPSRFVMVRVEEDSHNYHYRMRGADSTRGGDKIFARFGDLENLLERLEIKGDEAKSIGELIHFRAPSSLSKYYGVPDWLACVASIELQQAQKQHTFDFFINRGVPEFMLFLLGKKVRKEDWNQVVSAMKANIGVGNSHMSVALNITDHDMEVVLHKLALEGKSDSSLFKDLMEALALMIVSAHRVPPLLAGIQIPGKLGASNELVNALMAFQILVCGPAQKSRRRKLARTLGNPELNGGLGLNSKSFTFKTIIDELGLSPEAMETVGRMREPAVSAVQEGRNLEAGVRKLIREVGKDEFTSALSTTLHKMLSLAEAS